MPSERLGPHQRVLAQAIRDGARLYRTAAGWYTEHQGRRTRQDRERCSGMYVRGVLVLDGTDELSNGESRDRYVLSEAGIGGVMTVEEQARLAWAKFLRDINTPEIEHAFQNAVYQAVLAERERCAKIAESFIPSGFSGHFGTARDDRARTIAHAIRNQKE